MSPLLMKAVFAITAALVFYTVGVWYEHLRKLLKPIHLVFFWLGFVMDATGTHMMSLINGGETGMLTNVHGITGVIAILLMLVHAVWASIVLASGNEKAQQSFHRFSLLVWLIWLIPFLIGMVMGMR